MPKGDVLLYTGDLTRVGKPEEIMSFNAWLGLQDYQHKIGIVGNHDLLFEDDRKKACGLFTEGVLLFDETYLLPVAGQAEPLKIWGTPWNPWFQDWAFNLQRGPEMASRWMLVPDDVDILLTHTPPYGIQDFVDNRHGRGPIGCEELRKRVDDIAFAGEWKQRLNCFGHVHESYGHTVDISTRWTFVNGSNCLWTLNHPPYVIDYNSETKSYRVVEDQTDW